ncbi:hypothetical protein [Thiocystis violacea]|uniref:hypothetical protein n=1 Tax=Thiocystis violacea TaxID=13725 RepID=UPI001903B4C5|nr:hypothetical protein [Thiocystis violacea]MBK1719202.1 hypothetical protein [Thiocystis violacea]
MPAGDTDRSLGQWNAWVEQGETLQERRARLAQVPDDMRDQVKSHLTLSWHLKSAKRQKSIAGKN